MAAKTERFHKFGDLKQNIENNYKCPICNEKLEIGVEVKFLRKFNGSSNLVFRHIQLHGNPLHAVVCTIDTHLVVRNIQPIESVEINGDMETFTAMTKKWANPL